MSQGTTAEFNCEVTGSPPPKVRWIKENGNLPSGSQQRTGTLTGAEFSIIFYEINSEQIYFEAQIIAFQGLQEFITIIIVIEDIKLN